MCLHLLPNYKGPSTIELAIIYMQNELPRKLVENEIRRVLTSKTQIYVCCHGISLEARARLGSVKMCLHCRPDM